MTAYFRVSGSPNDLALLPVGKRTATELTRIAAEAEQDVTDFYTRRVSTLASYLYGNPGSSAPGSAVGVGRYYVPIGDGTRGVYLQGYAEDPTAADATFAAAFRRAIATVITWRLTQESRDTAVSSESGQNVPSKTYLATADEPFPKHWDRGLAQFSTLEPGWQM